ncbi:MAG TPA: flagellar protein FliT [Hyphomicrobiales bacterium]|nr:flagellar protein FliT [Hyphomicrobiales bacterium]
MYIVDRQPAPTPQQRQELSERERRFQLARVLRLTETMLQRAEAGAWEELEMLERERKDELDQCFDMQCAQPSLDVAEALAALVHLNERIVALVREARDALGAAHRAESGRHRAAGAYSEQLPSAYSKQLTNAYSKQPTNAHGEQPTSAYSEPLS